MVNGAGCYKRDINNRLQFGKVVVPLWIMGRPSDYSKTLATDICNRLAEGEPLAEICRDQGMPHPSTFRRWAKKEEWLSLAIAAIESRVEIYALCDPETDEVRYIGKANNSQKRLASHFRDARRRKTPVYCWINKLSLQGKLPVLRVVSVVPCHQWEAEEREMIRKYSSDRLLNLAAGGVQPYCPSSVRKLNAEKTLRLDESLPGARALNRLLVILKTWHAYSKRTHQQTQASRIKRQESMQHINDMIQKFGTHTTAILLADRMPWLRSYL